MTEERVKTSFWVSAEIRKLEGRLITAMVRYKGDVDRGLVLIKQNLMGDGSILYTQGRDPQGRLGWRTPLGPDPLPEDKAEDYIARQRKFDEDLWVLEIEDPQRVYVPGE
ncbi:DUF1491 family protein [Luteithermobacter gelatinilyticus]|uniref:DUF1491 family protein n=1 Tax=Luteithermobacter gelatinilyticus TaxID=2582913 RepID=UPI0011059603|nr:DUF1491 family protein [Luteithermobacter gelatinilyticus]|tara:strand:+ start:6638 stop:6967 length:330 start_codon:yes stop_codon:yes gene_type:complete